MWREDAKKEMLRFASICHKPLGYLLQIILPPPENAKPAPQARLKWESCRFSE